MDSINPIVLTSKQATDHLNKIKVEHSDLLTGIQNQAMKVEAYNQQKALERQNQDQMNKELGISNKKLEMDDQKMTMEAETKKLAEQNKAKELEIKQAALSMP